MQKNWEADKRIIKRALHDLSNSEKENRHLRKRSEDYQVIEEVFDKSTLMTLYSLLNKGLFDYLNGVVSTGKESRVYWGVREQGKDIAVKIYLVVASDFKKRLSYISGDPRFRVVRRGSWNIVKLWARKEYKNLCEASKAGIPVPNSYGVKENVLLMEFMGKRGVPFPLLGEVEVNEQDYKSLISLVRRLYRNAKLVHADLSEYNVFKKGKRLILFDFGSAVNIEHPLSKEFLLRDITNVNRFFARRGINVKSSEEILNGII